MSTLKIKWVPVAFLADYDPKAFPDDVPVVRLEALREWLRAHQYPLQYGEVNARGVINDLLDELKDKP